MNENYLATSSIVAGIGLSFVSESNTMWIYSSFAFYIYWYLSKISTWQDECDEAGGDGHGAKDEGGDDGADLSQGGHSGGQSASHL